MKKYVNGYNMSPGGTALPKVPHPATFKAANERTMPAPHRGNVRKVTAILYKCRGPE